MTASAPPIAIRAVGLISPLGHGAWPTFAALLKGKTLADRARQTSEAASPAELALAAGGVSIARHTSIDPAVELAEFAAREALQAANLESNHLPTYLGTSKGAVAALHRAADLNQTGRLDTDTALAVALGPHGYLAHHLTMRLGLSIQSHHVAACASSLTALHRARLALQNHDHPNFALVLTAEAAILPIFVHAYHRLGVLAPLTPDDYCAAPLDQSRRGFMLSEIGAAVLLERLPHKQSLPPDTTILENTAVACESFDLLRTNPDMPALKHIAEKLLAGQAIDMLHPHAPGTLDHDPAELAALGEVLNHLGQTAPPDVYAVKGALGHSLGAAGLTSLVIASLILKTGKRPPMEWLKNPIDTGTLNLPLNPAAQSARTQRHAIFAAGFAGHTAGAVIARN